MFLSQSNGTKEFYTLIALANHDFKTPNSKLQVKHTLSPISQIGHEGENDLAHAELQKPFLIYY